MTNIMAYLVVMVVTNIYSPKQYWHQMNTWPPSEGRWVDEQHWYGINIGIEPRTRDNPDVQYIEVREITKLHFLEHDVPDHVISDILLHKTKRIRTIKEDWKDEKVEVVPVSTNTSWVVTNGLSTMHFNSLEVATNYFVSVDKQGRPTGIYTNTELRVWTP